MSTKYCPSCSQDRPTSEFPVNRSRADGLGGWCRPCMRQYTQKWKKANPELNALHSRLHRANKKLKPSL